MASGVIGSLISSAANVSTNRTNAVAGLTGGIFSNKSNQKINKANIESNERMQQRQIQSGSENTQQWHRFLEQTNREQRSHDLDISRGLQQHERQLQLGGFEHQMNLGKMVTGHSKQSQESSQGHQRDVLREQLKHMQDIQRGNIEYGSASQQRELTHLRESQTAQNDFMLRYAKETGYHSMGGASYNMQQPRTTQLAAGGRHVTSQVPGNPLATQYTGLPGQNANGFGSII